MMNNFTKKTIKANFNRACDSYDDHAQVQKTVCQQLLKELLRYNHNFPTVCDLACGTGSSTHLLLEDIEYNQAVAIDISEKPLQIARKKSPINTTLINADFDNPLFKTNSVDLFFCNMGFQWSFDIKTLFKSLYSSLRSQGLLAFSLPIEGNFPEIRSNYKNKQLSHDVIKQYLSQNKFSLKSCHTHLFCETFHSPIDALRSIKKVGANAIISRTNTITHAFSKKLIDRIFLPSSTCSLTYHIGFYIAQQMGERK